MTDAQQVHLEVEQGDSNWQSVGNVRLLDDAQLPSSSLATRQQLPKSVKRLLAPEPSKRKEYYLYRHASPSSSPNTNLLILLHGAGDTHIPFDKLGRTMELPQTATLALSAKDNYTEIPFGLGFTWFQEMDYETGEALEKEKRKESLRKATMRLYNVIKTLVLDENWMIPERIFLLGYGAGATLAMELCNMWTQKHQPLGGAICVAGGSTSSSDSSPSETITPSNNSKTPILLMVGELDLSFSPSQAEEAREQYGEEACQVFVEPDKMDGMIRSSNEMQQVMEFLSQRLVRISSMTPR